MATIANTHPTPAGNPINDARYNAWLQMASGDVGARAHLGGYAARKMIQAILTGLAGSVSLRGSNLPDPDVTNPAHWFPLNNAANVVIALTTSGAADSNQGPLWVSPIVSGGDGTTRYDLYLLSRTRL